MWVKICGIRDSATAEVVAACRPDAVGLNFFAGSPRGLTPRAATEIVRILPEGVEPVGVFVNHSREFIVEVCRSLALRCVQLHGDEPAEFAAALPGVEVIRAFRVGDEGLAGLRSELDRHRALGVPLRACLVDARVPGLWGGTGQPAPWELLGREWQREDWPPLVLAGGLTPQNVAEAIRTAQPWGVDVAGGVESSAGVKDPTLVQEFLRSARTCAAPPPG